MKKIIHIIEFIIAKTFIVIFSILPFAIASDIGGFLGRHIGPHLKVTTTARNNIKLAMPELSETRVDEIILGMWDNLGRVITEYSQMGKMTSKKIDELVEIEGQEHLDSLINDKGSFLMTGHLGNWEMTGTTTYRRNCKLHIVYRKANNPFIDKIICDIRNKYQLSSSPKGTIGARQIIKALKEGKHIAMLVDQKQNDGISVPFFGTLAMTAPAIATLSLKYDANIHPGRIVRVNGSKFKFIFYPAIKISKTDNTEQDILKIMIEINLLLEQWIREYPEQWFWVHNRWPKQA